MRRRICAGGKAQNLVDGEVEARSRHRHALVELGDDDQERSLQRAHRLWWNSGLERYQFHNAMKAARHVTLARLAVGQVGGRPMASFFGVLAGAAADECVKAGLPLPRGWELAADDEGDERKPVHHGRSAAVAAGA